VEHLNYQWRDLSEIFYGHFHENGPREVVFGESQTDIWSTWYENRSTFMIIFKKFFPKW
jgi:hypothetical protein